MNENIYNENIDNFNNFNAYNIRAIDDLDLDKYPGIFSDASDNKNIINNNMNQDNYGYLLANEDAIPYSPEMSEEPEHPNKKKKIITDNIINHKTQQNEENIFTFKNNIKSLDNFVYSNTEGNLEQNQNFKKINSDNINKRAFNNKIKTNILNLENMINKKNNNIIRKSKTKVNNNNNLYINNNNIARSNFNEPNGFNKKIYQNKTNKNFQNKEFNNMKKINNLKKTNKSHKKLGNKKKIFDQKSLDTVEFEKFINVKKSQKLMYENTPNNKSQDKIITKMNKDKINDFFNPKQTSEITKIPKTKINPNTQRRSNKLKNIKAIPNIKEISSDNIINYNNFKKGKNNRNKIKYNNDNNNKSVNIDKDNSLISAKSQIIKRKRPNTLRSIKKIENDLVPKEVTEAEINLALEKENVGKNIQKRFSPINNKLINFDNSKFTKYDTDQIRYGLIKDYSNIHPEKDESFLQRMQFYELKRKNKDMKINELLEKRKKKYKIKEAQREKAFDRLTNDANRRLILKQEILENEKYSNDFKDLLDNKKYNGNEWNEIYNKRFKYYEECKKKKMDIKMQNEKIKKMIKEEEEMNLCQMKKLPEKKIKENTQRLYDDAKKREMIKNKNLKEANSVRNYKIYKKENALLTSFDDEDDASKYMKGYKSGTYKFIGENENNKSYNNYNIYNNRRKNYFNNNYFTENMNKSFDKKSLRKSNKMTVTEFNNRRFDTNTNVQIKRKKKPNINNNKNSYVFKDNKSRFNDFNLDNNNDNNYDISRYFSLKNNNFQNDLPRMQNNNFSSQIPYGYNYNNYNIYNINNLNNNINNINTNDENDVDNYNLTNLAEQLIHTAAINKIESNKKKLNMNNLYYPDNIINKNNYYNNNNYNNINEKYFEDKNNIEDKYKYENQNQNIDYNSRSDANKLVEQFLMSKYEY